MVRTVITKAVVGFQESVDNSMAALQNALRTKLQQSTTLYSELNKKLESVLQVVPLMPLVPIQGSLLFRFRVRVGFLVVGRLTAVGSRVKAVSGTCS